MTDNFSDYDSQLLGSAPKPENSNNTPRKGLTPHRKKLLAIFALCFSIGLIVGILYARHARNHSDAEMAERVYDEEATVFENEEAAPSTEMLDSLLSPYDSASAAGCAIVKLTQNDIPLTVYYPRNARARLAVGTEPLKEKHNILVLQAADIRADNGEIVGAFVEKGEPLAWGLSKQGFCGIIHDTITVGVAENSPLFERATETQGYFFRQYPLVDNYHLVESSIKTKSVRRALCDVCGRIVVIECKSKESMHDFSQALVDMGVRNAIYLIGSTALGSATDLQGQRSEWGKNYTPTPKFINYIYWEKL